MSHIIPPFSSSSDPGYKFLRVFGEYYMDREEEITLYVEGGVAPYDWEVDNEMFTLGAAQTADQSNTIEASANATRDVPAVVTVTDAEMSTVEIIVCVCAGDCCESDPDTFEFDDDNTEDGVPDGECIDLYVLGGCVPISWEILSGSGFTLTDEITYVNHVEICASSPDCVGEIKATDACGSEVEFEILGNDVFEFDDDNTPNTISPGGSINIYVLGGQGPFNWTVSGLGYSLDAAQTVGRVNGLNVASGTCDVDYGPQGVVTITDACGEEVFTIILISNGTWRGWEPLIEYVYEDICVDNPCVRSPNSWFTDYLTEFYCPGRNFRRQWKNAAWGTCSEADPNDCCGDGNTCGYSQTPQYALCDMSHVYVEPNCGTLTTPEKSAVCEYKLSDNLWVC